MVRQRPRKTVEELYAPKYEATNPLKNLGGTAGSGGAAQKTRRSSEQEYSGGGAGYIITSTAASYNSTATAAAGVGANMGPPPPGNTGMTTRRKTARNSAPHPQPQPHSAMKYKDDKARLEEMKKEHNLGGGASVGVGMKTKTARASGSGGGGGGIEKVITPYDGKSYVNFIEPKEMHGGSVMHAHHHHHHSGHHNQQQQQQQHHAAMMQQQAMMMEEDKDEETEEFFELIRMTVEGAIGKAFSELFNRNFRELTNRVDSLAIDIKNTNQLLNKVQTEMINKVSHYGEENSRHFRYLCMKSEYDKMFYQHQTMMVNQNNNNNNNTGDTVPPKAASPMMTLPTSPPKSTGATPKREPTRNVPMHKRKGVPSSSGDGINHRATPTPIEPHKSSSDEHVLSPKSSEVGMREVLEQIQRFCNQLQLNDLKSPDDPSATSSTAAMSKEDDITLKASTSSYHTVSSIQTAVEQQVRNPPHRRQRSRLQESMKLNKRVFDADDEDEDDFGISSDGLSPRTEDEDRPPKNYPGGMTMRCPSNTTRLSGGGDS